MHCSLVTAKKNPGILLRVRCEYKIVNKTWLEAPGSQKKKMVLRL